MKAKRTRTAINDANRCMEYEFLLIIAKLVNGTTFSEVAGIFPVCCTRDKGRLRIETGIFCVSLIQFHRSTCICRGRSLGVNKGVLKSTFGLLIHLQVHFKVHRQLCQSQLGKKRLYNAMPSREFLPGIISKNLYDC